MITQVKQQEALSGLIKRLQKEGYWGKVIISFRAGDIVMTEQSRTIPTEILVKEELDGN